MPRWTFHDLRRTARTIMAAAGVQRDIAERVLGHVIPGVEGVLMISFGLFTIGGSIRPRRPTP
jgi:hypothetical protein